MIDQTENNFKYESSKILYKNHLIQTYTFGSGDKVIFSIPSFSHSGLSYIFFAKFYDQTKYRFITFDLPGYAGDSDNVFKSTKYSLKENIEIAKAVIDHYKLKQFNLLGYSFGASLALMLASELHEKINKIVIVSGIVNGKLLNHTLAKRSINLMKLLNLNFLMKLIVLGSYQIFKPILRNLLNTSLINQYGLMMRRSDGKILLDSLYILFQTDLTDSLNKLKSLQKNILVINSVNEDKMYRIQSRYIKIKLKDESHFVIKGRHEDFLLRPKSYVVKKVLGFLVS